MIDPLTPREAAILSRMVVGMNKKEIARDLCIGSATVRTHLVSIYSKLDVHSGVEAVLVAIRLGIVHRTVKVVADDYATAAVELCER